MLKAISHVQWLCEIALSALPSQSPQFCADKTSANSLLRSLAEFCTGVKEIHDQGVWGRVINANDDIGAVSRYVLHINWAINDFLVVTLFCLSFGPFIVEQVQSSMVIELAIDVSFILSNSLGHL